MLNRLDLTLTRTYLDEAVRELRQVETRLSAQAENGGSGVLEDLTLARGHVSHALWLLDGKLADFGDRASLLNERRQRA